jgi:hypothetical protein
VMDHLREVLGSDDDDEDDLEEEHVPKGLNRL